MGLICLQNLPPPTAAVLDSILDQIHEAFMLAALGHLMELLRDLVAKYSVQPFLRGHAVSSYNKEPETLREMVQYLLAQGADPNATTDSKTPLYCAAYFGAENVVPLLIDAGAEIDVVCKFQSLHAACSRGRAGCAKLLVDAGASVEIADERGRRPLHSAAASWRDYAEVIKVLLDGGGADVDALDAYGWVYSDAHCE
ncbi:hypothetical protein HDU96_006883 [Phlyctochytrium bullatum]|nr:hypothetical protein HDU96_006883 [Phlyctochytrium bullatum]